MNQGDFVGPAALSDKSRIFFGLFSLISVFGAPVWGVAPEQDHAPLPILPKSEWHWLGEVWHLPPFFAGCGRGADNRFPGRCA